MDQCPFCKSTSYRKLKSMEEGMTYTQDRQCNRCECVWRPGCPKWVAIIALVVGIAVFVVGLFGVITFFLEPPQGPRGGRHIIVMAGIAALGGLIAVVGIRALLGQWGAMEILEAPKKKI